MLRSNDVLRNGRLDGLGVDEVTKPISGQEMTFRRLLFLTLWAVKDHITDAA